MFRGNSAISLDAKGRIAIPARWRNRFMESDDGQLVYTVDPWNKCLLLYTFSQWLKLEQLLTETATQNPMDQQLKSLMIGQAVDVEMDKNGRFILAAPLREYAQLKKQAYMVADGNRFRIWSDENYNIRLQNSLDALQQPGAFEQLSESVRNLGL